MLHPETAYTIINLSVTAHNVIFAQSSLSWGQITRARGFKKIKLFFLMLSGELSYTLRHASSYVNKASKERVYFVHDQIFFNPRPSNTLKFRVTLNELQQMEPQGGNDPSASIYTLQDHKRGIFVGHHGMAVSKGALQSTFRDNLVISHSTLPGQKSIILGTDNRNYKTHLIYNDLQNFDICKLGDRNFAIYNGIQIFNNFETVCTKGFCMRFLPTHLHVQDTKRSLISGHSIYEGVIGGNYYSQIVPFYHSMGLISEREKRLFEIYAEISHTVNSLQLTQDPNMLDPSSITFSFMHKKRFEIDKAVRELEDPFSRIFSFRKND